VRENYGDTLREITGMEFGNEQKEWLDWWESNKNMF
jgi:hypothetical protein